MNPQRVSVIICTHNHEKYLEKTVRSVLDQKQPFGEVLVVDAESTDRTPEIAQSFEGVSYRKCVNKSPAETYNQAISNASGEFYCMLDGDDYWDTDFWKLLSKWWLKFPDAAISVGKMKNFNDFEMESENESSPAYYQLDPYGFSTLCIRSEIFSRIGTFDDKFSLASDMDWLLRARDSGVKIIEIPEIMAHRRLHSNSCMAKNESARLHYTTRLLRESMRRKRQAGR